MAFMGEMGSDRVMSEQRGRQRLHGRWLCPGLAVVPAVVCLLVGCSGGGSLAVTSPVEAHTFALANAICQEYNTDTYAERALEEKGNAGTGPEQFLAHKEMEIARLRAVLSVARKLPRAGAYISDLAAQDGLLTALSKEVGKGYKAYMQLALSKSYRDESRRLDIKVAADAKALHLAPCIGLSPRHPIGG
jgi:hypothetical protein